MTDLLKRLPPVYTNGENAKLLEAVEMHRLALEQRIYNMRFNWNPDKCPPEQLDVMLRLLGWTADIELTERQKRKLVKMVAPIQALGGTDIGMIRALRYLMGVDVSVRQHLRMRYHTDGSTFPPGDRGNYSFDVIFPLTARDEDVALAKELIEYMMPPNTYYTPIQLLQIEQTKTVTRTLKMTIVQKSSFNRYDPTGVEVSRPLTLDGSWRMDGTYYLWGDKMLPPERKSEAKHTVSLTVITNGTVTRSGEI